MIILKWSFWRQWSTSFDQHHLIKIISHCHVWCLGGKWRSASSSDGILDKDDQQRLVDAMQLPMEDDFLPASNWIHLDSFKNERDCGGENGFRQASVRQTYLVLKGADISWFLPTRNYHDLIFYVFYIYIAAECFGHPPDCPCRNHGNLTVDPQRRIMGTMDLSSSCFEASEWRECSTITNCIYNYTLPFGLTWRH